MGGSGVGSVRREEIVDKSVGGLEAVGGVTAVIEEEGGGGVREGFGLDDPVGDGPHVFFGLSVTKTFKMFCGGGAEGVGVCASGVVSLSD